MSLTDCLTVSQQRALYTHAVSQYIQQDINFSCMFKVNVTIKAVY